MLHISRKITCYGINNADYSVSARYNSRAVKRVMFDGGYATFDAAGVPGWHYFLCDHAGSVRVVADMWGRAEQINHYYPYGLTFADAGKAPDHQPCKFGGKELDAMYGLNLHDFHARLQIPDLGRFDRPDPLCEKTPHLSPYLFCANDPVNNIDPTGMDIVIFDDDDEKYWYRQLADNTYGFVNSAGELYCGNSEKIEEISLGLQSLQSGEVGNALVESLISNKNELCIEFSTEKNDGNSFSESGTIKWNPYDMFCGLSMDANGEYTPFAPSFISLGHELAHAEDFFSGSMNYSTWYSYNGKSVEYNELKACHVENMIRAEHNVPLRTHYSRTQFDNPVEKSRVTIFPNFSLYFGKTPNFLNFKF